MAHFDFKTLLPALLQVEDRMSMAHGLESRVPFLDHPLVQFVATIPPNIKFANGELKRLLRVAFGSRLPESIRNRSDKMGFPVPLNQWLKNKTKADIDGMIKSQGAFNRNLWALLSLEIWQQEFIDA